MHKSSSFTLLNGEGLQNRWRQTSGINFIRIRKNKFRFHFIYLLATIFLFLIVYIALPSSRSFAYVNRLAPSSDTILTFGPITYNATYPLTKPMLNQKSHQTIYRIGLIADLDTNSKRKDQSQFSSYLKKGHLYVGSTHSTFDFKWDTEESTEIKSGYALKGRGMELSELVTFNGRLLTFDDRTGIVFELQNNNVAPWVILSDGLTPSPKGFKSEWATVKNGHLFVGSMGKEWTDASGSFENYNPMMVKVINVNGEVKTLDWVKHFKAIRTVLDIEWPGYMIHESGAWSDHNQKWFFLPRRCSKDRYNETLDESRGCNYLITANESFTDINAIKVGLLRSTRGYSSFKFLPGSLDSIIVALKTEELNGMTATYVTIFDITGNILLDDEKIHNYKFEGLEFI